MNINNLKISEKEFNYYLEEFKKEKYFAAIKAGGECLGQELADSLKFLYEQGLYPIVVHGGGKQIDEALSKEGIETRKINGKRITDAKTLEIVVKTLTQINKEFVSMLNNEQIRAKDSNEFFYAEQEPEYGYVGKVIGFNKFWLDIFLLSKKIPVVSCLGVDLNSQHYNINADSAYSFLVTSLKPKKSVILTPVGGVYKNSEIISELNYGELETLLASDYVNGGMLIKLEEIKKLAEQGIDVQITNAQNLLSELFSEKGCGTYIHSK